MKKTETMVQTDFKDEIDLTPQSKIDIEATKLWLIQNFEKQKTNDLERALLNFNQTKGSTKL